jgi:uncharacterized membrane protein
MSHTYLEVLTDVAAVGSGVMGGLLFAFSSTVMPALGRIPDRDGITAMQAINKLILNPLFGLLFFGTAGSCAAIVVDGLIHGHGRDDRRLIGAAVYLVGFLLVTVAVHLPLNNRLDTVDASASSSVAMWRRFRTRWNAFNHVRALAAVAACVLLTTAPSISAH